MAASHATAPRRSRDGPPSEPGLSVRGRFQPADPLPATHPPHARSGPGIVIAALLAYAAGLWFLENWPL